MSRERLTKDDAECRVVEWLDLMGPSHGARICRGTGIRALDLGPVLHDLAERGLIQRVAASPAGTWELAP